MLKYKSTVARKGQVTIPKEFRDQLGLAEGDKVEWSREGDRIILKPAGSVVERTFGAFKDATRPFTSYEDEERALEEAMLEDWRETLSRM